MMPDWDFESHCDTIGPPQTGKTSFAIVCKEKHVLRGNHIVDLGWKRDAYEAITSFTAVAAPDFPVVLLNPADCDPIVPYNPFKLPKGRNLSAHVKRLSKLVLAAVSHQPLAQLQNYAYAAEAFLSYVAVSGEPVSSAIRLFDPSQAKAWLMASEKVPEQFARMMRRIAQTTPKEWDYKLGALERRLRPFVTSDALRKFTSSQNTIDIGDLFERRVSLFVNSGPSRFLDEEAAQIFLSFILSDILQVGIENASNRGDTYVYADEIQEYAPDNFGSLIDLVLGAGIKITTIHHFSGQFDERIRQSIENNTRIKVLFGGISPAIRRQYAEIAWPHELNEDVVKQERFRSITDYYEDQSLSFHTDAEGNMSETMSDRLHPESYDVSAGFDFRSPEEKLSIAAARFLVPNRQYHVIFPDGTVERSEVPTLRKYLYNSPDVLEFIKRQPSITPDEAERIHNLERSNDAGTRTRTKKKPTLFNAG